MLLEYGAALAGIVVVTVNTALTDPEARYVLGQSRSAFVLHDAAFRGRSLTEAVATIGPELAELRGGSTITDFFAHLDESDATLPLPDVSPDDPAQIQYTSGTTGFPKGALLRHRSVTNVPRLSFARAGVAAGAVYLTPLPLFHTASCCVGVLGPASTCGTLVIVCSVDPAVALQLLEEEGAVAMGGVPTVYTALLAGPDLPARTAKVTTLLGGGAPVQSE